MLHNRSHDIMKVMAKDDVIAVPPMEENEVLLSYLSPVWQLSDKVNVALLGEMDKFVPISPERIKALDFHEPGVAHLRVEVRYLDVMVGRLASYLLPVWQLSDKVHVALLWEMDEVRAYFARKNQVS